MHENRRDQRDLLFRCGEHMVPTWALHQTRGLFVDHATMHIVRLKAELTLALVARSYHYFFFPRVSSSLSTFSRKPFSCKTRCLYTSDGIRSMA
jgi:hypothetical protein